MALFWHGNNGNEGPDKRLEIPEDKIPDVLEAAIAESGGVVKEALKLIEKKLIQKFMSHA